MKTLNKQIKSIITILMVLIISQGFGQLSEITGKLPKAPEGIQNKTGNILFDQISTPGSAFMLSHHFTTIANNTETCAVADDFVVPEGETFEVHSIGILGTYWEGEPGGGDALNVLILDDEMGKPGDTVVKYEGYQNFLQEEFLINGYVESYFEIYLPEILNLSEGTYWVSVQMRSDVNVTGKWGWTEHLFEDAFFGEQWHWINPKDGFGYGYTDWTPAEVVVGPWVAWEMSFALFGAPPQNDISTLAITSPEDYFYGPPVDEQEVTAIIKNEGVNSQTGFDVTYNINGTEVTENIGSVTLDYNDIYEYTFTETVDLSTPGFYNLSVSVDIENDEVPENNTQELEITVFDPTIYPMPSMQTTSITVCSGTFADAGGIDGDLTVDDWGVLTIYPATAGAKIKLDFIQFDIAWSDFWIYDGENINAPLLGWWEDDISPGSLTAGYNNTSGALTIHFQAQGWTPFEAPGWAANISCHVPVEDDFEVLKLELSHPAVFEYDYVTAFAHVKNIGTTILEKDVTFSANGEVYATATTGMVNQSDTVVVEVIWNPSLTGDYDLLATVPDDQGPGYNSAGMSQYVYPFDHFYEGFELPLFPPDGWSQSSNAWTHHTYAPSVGTGHAYCWVEYGLYDTLITPKLHIEEGDFLAFSAFSSAWWPGEMDLCWIDGETGVASLIVSIPLPFVWYQNFEYDVSAAAGDNYLAFVGKYNPQGGQGELKLDEVEGIGIERFYYEDDLKAYTLGGDITPEENVPTSLEIDIKNIGSQLQSGSEYTVKLMQEPGIELMSYNGQDINPKEVLTYELEYTFPYAGLYNCYVVVDFEDDQDMSNNTSSSLAIYVQQEGTEQVEIGPGNDWESNWWHPITISATGLYSQTLFLAEDVGEANTITGLMYYYHLDENYPIYDAPITIWMTETDEENMTDSLEAANNYDLVFEGTFDAYPGYHGVYIPLDFVYSYQGGNLMVTTYKDFDSGQYASFYVKTSATQEVMVRYFNGYENGDPFSPYDQSSIDSLYLHQAAEYGNIKLFKFNLEGQYCTPQVLNGTAAGDYIDGVEFGEIENMGTGSQGGLAYNNYTSMSSNLERGRTYELTIQAETSGDNGSIAAWIDFNGNNELDDEGERVVHMSSDEASQEITVQVTIPDDASIGLTILRVRNSSEADLFASCQAVDYGETEDYGINIIETIQVYNPVPEFSATLLEDGNVDLNWMVPDNPGVAQQEGFEMSMWPPQGGWDVKQSTTLDGTLNDPTGDTWMQYDEDMQYVYNGAYSALSPASAMDFNWLITPQVQLYGNDELSFMLNYSADAAGYSKFYVLAEVDGEWTTVLEYTEEVTMYNNYDEEVTVELSQFAGKVVRLAFVSEYNDAYPIAIDEAILRGMTISDKSVSGITGYEIVKNGEVFATIDDPSETMISDVLSITENYIYCITAVYEDGEKSESMCDNAFYLEPLTPPMNVIAASDDDDVTIIWTAPDGGIERFADDFENYNAGEQVACQNPEDWTTWTLEPCGSTDPYITTDNPYTGDNSVVIEYDADLLYLTDELLTHGKYSYNFMMYVVDGYNGYFNVLQDHNLTAGALWGMQAFFDENGIGTVDGGGYGAATFIYDYNEWMYMEVVVDLDTDWAQYLIDGELIHEWQWSTGISGAGNGWLTLEGGDFYAWNTNNTCKYFIDDFQIIQLYESEDLVSYNVYKDGSMLGTTDETIYSDDNVEPGYHEYCVSAIYDEGESDQVCDFITVFSAPANFTAEVQNETEVYCTWDAISSGTLEGYQVYRDGQMISGLITDAEWTDTEAEGGTHNYYATAVYANGESVPSNVSTVILLLVPTNLVANADDDGNIVLDWDPVGELVVGDMVKLSQHDNVPANGLYQYYNIGYGVIFDISAYPGATIEMADFHHSSYGITGNWSYMMHVIDWTNLTEIGFTGPFQTTGNDIWELSIPLGSLPASSTQIAIFLEPMSNDPEDAYPILSIDGSLEGNSLSAALADLTQSEVAPGDFLLDLWIFAPDDKKIVKAKKLVVDNQSVNARNAFAPVKGEISVVQKEKGGKALTGYNVYYSHDSDPYDLIDLATDTTYSHEGAGYVLGLHKYYVTANYDEGESDASNIATEYISAVSENLEGDVSIYPNPILDVVNIQTGSEIISLMVVNAQGQVVREEKDVNSNNTKIDLSNQPTGIYNVRIETEEGWLNRKMIKK